MKLFDPIELLIYKFSFRHCGGPKMASPQSHRIFLTLHLQCFIVSTVKALQTPMINASMVSFYSRFVCFILCIFFLFPHFCVFNR